MWITVQAERMLVNDTRISPDECQQWQDEVSCFYCSLSSHFLWVCLLKPMPHGDSGIAGGPSHKRFPDHCFCFPLSLIYGNKSHASHAFVASATDQNLICSSMVNLLKILSIPLGCPFSIQALDGSNLSPITHQAAPVMLQFSGNHTETLSLLSNTPILQLSWVSPG